MSPSWPPLLLVGLVAACGSEAPSPQQTSAGETVAEPTPSPAVPAQPAPEAFDFRRLRIAPDQGIGQTVACHVDTVGRLAEVSERDAPPTNQGMTAVHHADGYPDWVYRRQDMRCVSAAARTWIDVLYDEGQVQSAYDLRQGSVIQVRVLGAYEGFSDYPYAQFVDVVPGASAIAGSEDSSPTRLGFDFTRLLGEPRLVDSDQECAVDFVSQIKPVDERLRRNLDYRDDIAFRADVRCLHEGGDSWIDAVAETSDAELLLRLCRGATVQVQVHSADGGFADYPIVQVQPQ